MVSGGVVERDFEVHGGPDLVPGTVWTPDSAPSPAPVVLLGYGSGGHRRDDSRLWQADRLVREYGVAAALIDVPGHGERAVTDSERLDYGTVIDQVVAEWRAALDAVGSLPEVDPTRAAYRGVSMGTMLGLPFVASEPRIRAAVFGLADLRDVPGRYSLVGARLAADAPRVHCPVLFAIQWHDELMDRESAFRLFDLLGSADKRLHAHPGAHHEMPQHETEAQLSFLAQQLQGAP